jgi:hypothetical protein
MMHAVVLLWNYSVITYTILEISILLSNAFILPCVWCDNVFKLEEKFESKSIMWRMCGNLCVLHVWYYLSFVLFAKALVRLDVSHNPLGDGAIKHLSILLPQLVSLTVLQLQGCHLTTSCFKPEGALLNCK